MNKTPETLTPPSAMLWIRATKTTTFIRPLKLFLIAGLPFTVHLLRLYSMAFGLVTLIFGYLTAFEFYTYYLSTVDQPQGQVFSAPARFATAVAFFMATQPMFAFITASVANETANMAFCAIALWLTQRYVLRGPPARLRRAIALGITLGLISLSKMTGLSFGLAAVVALLQIAVTTRKISGAARLLWRDGVVIGVLFLAAGGWWYVRNYQLYGDFFQQGLYKLYFNVDPQPLTLSQFLYTLSTGEVSFWATFGWLNIVAPDWVYSIYRIVSRVGMVGVVFASIVKVAQWIVGRLEGWKVGGNTEILRLRGSISPLLIHLVFPIALAFSLTRLVATEGGLQGRQLLPALGSMAIVIVWGWRQLITKQIGGPVLTILGLILLALAVWLPYGVVVPAYIPTPLLTEAELPDDLPRLNLTYNEDMRLIGANVEAEVARPGQRVPVRAYWQALRPMEINYSVFVHLIGRNYGNVGQFNTYPGLGLHPTTTLNPGQIVVDTYPVLVNGGSEAPTRLLVNLGLFDLNTPGRPGIPAINSDGEAASPTVERLKLIPNEWPALKHRPPIAQFSDHITLVDYHMENCETRQGECQIIFEWLALGQPSTDYTVFIQLWPQPVSDEEPSFFGFDAPPLNNDYPTSLWAAQEVVIDRHDLDLTDLPPGEYKVIIGLYNPITGVRLSAGQNSKPLLNDAVDLETLEILPD